MCELYNKFNIFYKELTLKTATFIAIPKMPPIITAKENSLIVKSDSLKRGVSAIL